MQNSQYFRCKNSEIKDIFFGNIKFALIFWKKYERMSQKKTQFLLK